VAQALARFGVCCLVIIDPDKLEVHNLGEMECVSAADVGRNKTAAVAGWLRSPSSSRGLSVVALPESIFSLSSLVAVKRSDVLVCCADNAAARIATDFLAKLYLKPLLDIGTGVLRWSTGRRIGADIRLLLPERCLLCFGGVSELSQAREELLSERRAGAWRPTFVDWREERAGSLRSLNQIATGLGLRLIEEFVQGRLESSTWLQLDTADGGLPVLAHPAPPARNTCPLCRIAGRGDGGIELLQPVLYADWSKLPPPRI
jgi:hypothetical protein